MTRKGTPRAIHKYTARYWNVARQDWDYQYPSDMAQPSGTNGWNDDPDGNAQTARGWGQYQAKKEQELADEVDGFKAGDKRLPPPDDEDDKDEDEKFLEGFEEGFKLAKEVDRAEGVIKKSLLVLTVKRTR